MMSDYSSTCKCGIFKKIVSDIAGTLRTCIKTEINSNTITMYIVLGILAILAIYSAIIFLGFSLLFLLAIYLPMWAAALIVTVLCLFGAVVLGLAIKTQININQKKLKHH